MALGRGQNIDGWMPMSISSDKGKTWKANAGGLPPIGGGQRATLIRLKEGPLFFASFAEDVSRFQPVEEPNTRRHVSSLFGALSFDDGKTWPVRRVIADAGPEHGALTIDGGRIRMSPASSEPQGYLSSCQNRDGLIHLISSINHYAFNVAWLKQGPPNVPRVPSQKTLARRDRLGTVYRGAPLARFAAGPNRWSMERMGPFDAVNIENGLTVEVAAEGDVDLDLFVRGGPLTANHYAVRASSAGDAGRHVYRVAVRPDTAAQIYRDGELVSTQPAEVIIDWRQPARGSYLEWKARDAGATIDSVAIDLSGPYAPLRRGAPPGN